MAEKRINAGYEITDSLHIGKYEFVIGQNNTTPPMFVTWMCRDGNNYFWGHYLETREDAERDLLVRAGKELEQQKNEREVYKNRRKEPER